MINLTLDENNLYKNRLKSDKIKVARVSVNAFCNVGCWYCPVRYADRDFDRMNMSLEDLEKIILQLIDGKGKYVSEDFQYIWPEHYNEILLFPKFKEMLDLFRKYKIRMVLLSNGLALNRQKADLVLEYEDVCGPIVLNVPSLNPDLWAKYTDKPRSMFDKLYDNLLYVDTNVSPKIWTTIQVNGMDSESYDSDSWTISAKNGLEEFSQNDIRDEESLFRSTFKNSDILVQKNLTARGGFLGSQGIFENKTPGGRVVGCSANIDKVNHLFDVMSINVNGDVFLCCEDYEVKTKYGNIFEESIEDIWTGTNRLDAIDKASKGICTTCPYAIWEK